MKQIFQKIWLPFVIVLVLGLASIYIFFNVNIKSFFTPSVSLQKNSLTILCFDKEKLEQEFVYTNIIKQKLAKQESANSDKLKLLLNNYNKRLILLEKNKNSLTPQDVKKIKTELIKMQELYQQLKSTLEEDYTTLKYNLYKTMRIKIQKYIALYGEKHNVSYIIAKESNLIYYNKSALDITNELIQEVNHFYKTED